MKRILYLLGVLSQILASLLGTSATARAHEKPRDLAVESAIERVDQIRDQLLQESPTNDDPIEQAQWYNWRNWPNWNDWYNWPNWRNW